MRPLPSFPAFLVLFFLFPANTGAVDLMQHTGDRAAIPQIPLLENSSVFSKVTGEGEVRYNSLDAQLFNGHQQHRDTQLRYGITGDLADVRYGVDYHFVGDRFRGPSRSGPDQEGSEGWMERRFGTVRLKTVFSEFSNNVEHDVWRPTVTKIQGGPTVEFAVPHGPVLAASYRQGSLQTLRYQEPSLLRRSLETIGVSTNYGLSPSWSIGVFSEYSEIKDKQHTQDETTAFYNALDSAWRPTSSITIIPSFTLM